MVGAARGRIIRLRRKLEFDAVFARPQRTFDGYFTVLARVNEREYSRLGMVVSKRVDKRAVKRNQLKRIIRESFRHGSILAASLDLVVIAKSSAATAEPSQLRLSLDRHWQGQVKRKAAAQIG